MSKRGSSFFYFRFARCMTFFSGNRVGSDVGCCLMLVNRQKWKEMYVFIYVNELIVVVFINYQQAVKHVYMMDLVL